jgi:hypothetical protein
VIDLNEQAVVREIARAWLSWHEQHMEVPAAELPHVRYAEIAAKALEGQAAELRAAREVVELARQHATGHEPYPLPGLTAALDDYDQAAKP